MFSLCREGVSPSLSRETAKATTHVLDESREESLHSLSSSGMAGRAFFPMPVVSRASVDQRVIYHGDSLSPPTLPNGHGFLFCLEIMSHLELAQKYPLHEGFLFHHELIFSGYKIAGGKSKSHIKRCWKCLNIKIEVFVVRTV